MTLVLHGHPFSSYTQKVSIALYETATPFDLARARGRPSLRGLTAACGRCGLMPVLVEDGAPFIESSIIIEHVAPHLVPSLEVRFLDRFFDNYVMTPMQKIVGNQLRPEPTAIPRGVADAKRRLDVSYGWLDDD